MMFDGVRAQMVQYPDWAVLVEQNPVLFREASLQVDGQLYNSLKKLQNHGGDPLHALGTARHTGACKGSMVWPHTGQSVSLFNHRAEGGQQAAGGQRHAQENRRRCPRCPMCSKLLSFCLDHMGRAASACAF